MGIDRIGKGGGIAPTGAGNVSGSSPTGPTQETFKVARTAPTEAASNAALDRVRSGEMTINQYLDHQVDQATSHLSGKLSVEQMDFIRQSLREQLSSDPALVDLVKGATGAVPPSTE
jgi:hypothetical protein